MSSARSRWAATPRRPGGWSTPPGSPAPGSSVASTTATPPPSARPPRGQRLWCDEGQIGKIMFIRSRHGIAGREGYDREWRARGEISGGGELIDQGVHGLDLARWFLGEFSER